MADDPCRGKELLLSLVPPSLFRPERKVFFVTFLPSFPCCSPSDIPQQAQCASGGESCSPSLPSERRFHLPCRRHRRHLRRWCPPFPALRAREGRGQMSSARPLVRQGRVERGRASPIMSFHRCLHRNRRSPERKRKKRPSPSVGRSVARMDLRGGTDFVAAACCLTSTTPFTCPCLSPVHHTLDKKRSECKVKKK